MSMSINRFEKIRQFIHFNDNFILDNGNAIHDAARKDRLFKIRPLIDTLLTRFQTVPPPQKLSLDEQKEAKMYKRKLKLDSTDHGKKIPPKSNVGRPKKPKYTHSTASENIDLDSNVKDSDPTESITLKKRKTGSTSASTSTAIPDAQVSAEHRLVESSEDEVYCSMCAQKYQKNGFNVHYARPGGTSYVLTFEISIVFLLLLFNVKVFFIFER